MKAEKKQEQKTLSLTELKAMAFDRARLAEQFRAEATAISQEISKQEAQERQNQNSMSQITEAASTITKRADISKKTIKKAASK